MLSNPDDFGRFFLLNDGERRALNGVLLDVAVGVVALDSATTLDISDDALVGPPPTDD